MTAVLVLYAVNYLVRGIATVSDQGRAWLDLISSMAELGTMLYDAVILVFTKPTFLRRTEAESVVLLGETADAD